MLSIPNSDLTVDDGLIAGCRTAVVPGSWKPQYLQVMHDYGLNGLSLNVSHGWDGDTTFLPDMPIVGLHVLRGRGNFLSCYFLGLSRFCLEASSSPTMPMLGRHLNSLRYAFPGRFPLRS